MNKYLIVITDLDGTLLDHDTYQFDAALPAIEQLASLSIPLILNSSKTAAEILAIRQELENTDPFIVENGAGIYLPLHDKTGTDEYRIVRFGRDRDDIVGVLFELRDKFKLSYRMFSDMDIHELKEHTGLDQQQAEKAMQRDFTEPLLWQGADSEWNRFCTELDHLGLDITKGGRFYSVSGKVNKGQALQWLREHYRETLDEAPVFIALGDSENDKSMLELADYAVVIRSPSHAPPDISNENLIMSKEIGPRGWNETLSKLIEELE